MYVWFYYKDFSSLQIGKLQYSKLLVVGMSLKLAHGLLVLSS